MAATYLVTGASGFLGGAVCRELTGSGAHVRALVRPGTDAAALEHLGVEVVRGDVRHAADVDRFVSQVAEGAVAIHLAARVSIAWEADDDLVATNVGGTRNVVAACRRSGVRRLVHVASVHAVAARAGEVTSEPDVFDPDAVVGGYARTKATAAAIVRAAHGPELETVVLMPSGIVGPGDPKVSHLTALVRDIAGRRLPAYIAGGYEFVDVRDLAAAVRATAEHEEVGRGYILSSDYLTIEEVVHTVSAAAGVAPTRFRLPFRLAWALAPGLERAYRTLGRPPLFTRYSLRTLVSGERFCSERARTDLGFAPRDPRESIRAMVAELTEGTGQVEAG